MDDSQKSDEFYQMIQNLAILSKPQTLNLSIRKSGIDLDDIESQTFHTPTRCISDSSYLKTFPKEKSIRNHPKLKKRPEISRISGKTLNTDEDSDSNSYQSRKWYNNSQSSLQSTQFFPADSETDTFKTVPQPKKFHYMTIDAEDLQTKESSPKVKLNNSSKKPLSEKERLIELINLAAEENFELRKSNVKFQQQRRLQILKVRDLKFKISQQNQKISQQKAEEKAISNLENIIRAKQLEILSLKYQIKTINEKLLRNSPTEIEMDFKKPIVKSVAREHRRLKSTALVRESAKQIGDNDGVLTLASKLNQFLSQVAQLKENTVSQLQFFQQQHDTE